VAQDGEYLIDIMTSSASETLNAANDMSYLVILTNKSVI